MAGRAALQLSGPACRKLAQALSAAGDYVDVVRGGVVSKSGEERHDCCRWMELSESSVRAQWWNAVQVGAGQRKV